MPFIPRLKSLGFSGIAYKKGKSFIITVNHFTSKEMWKHDASDRNAYFSENRYQTAYNALKNIDYSDGVKHGKMALGRTKIGL